MVDEDSIRYQKKISAGFNSLRDYLLETSYRYFLEIDKEYTDIQQEKVLLFLERMEQNTYDKKGKTVADDETGQELDSTEDNNDNEEKILEDTDSDELLQDSKVQKASNQSNAEELTWDQEKYNRYSANYFIEKRKNNYKSNLKKLSTRYLINELKQFREDKTKKISLVHIKLFFHLCVNTKIFNIFSKIMSDDDTKRRLIEDFSKSVSHSNSLFDLYLNNSEFNQLLERLSSGDEGISKTDNDFFESNNSVKSSLLKKIISSLNNFENKDAGSSERINFEMVRYDFIALIIFRFFLYKISHEKLKLDDLHLYADALIESKGYKFDHLIDDTIPELILEPGLERFNQIKDLYFLSLLFCENSRNLYRKYEIELIQNYISDNYADLTNPLIKETNSIRGRKSIFLEDFADFYKIYDFNHKMIFTKNYRQEYILFLINLCFKALENIGFSEEVIKIRKDEFSLIYKKYEFEDMFMSAPCYYRYEIEKLVGKRCFLLKFTDLNKNNYAVIILKLEFSYISIEINFENQSFEILEHN